MRQKATFGAMLVGGLMFGSVLVWTAVAESSAPSEDHQLSAVWSTSGESRPLAQWSISELRKLSGATVLADETIPGQTQKSRWKGAKLGSLIDQAMAQMTAEQRAQVDLVILQGRSGRALLPRAFAVKYPVFVAYDRNGAALGADDGPLMSVLPWTTNAKIQKEGAPLETFFIRGLERLELANYRSSLGQVFLKRRTDPAAMRGERMFVQNCVTCHATGQGPGLEKISETERAARLSETGHPKVTGAPDLGAKDRRALRSYLDAFHSERS